MLCVAHMVVVSYAFGSLSEKWAKADLEEFRFAVYSDGAKDWEIAMFLLLAILDRKLNSRSFDHQRTACSTTNP
jgi:hypothetical protein